MAAELAGKAMVAQVNVEENPGLATRYGIRGVPALLLMHRGRVIETIGGIRDIKSLIALFRHHFPG